MAKVLVFGVFDGLHPGHLAMLKEINGHGEVVVALADDSVVERLKGKRPEHDFVERQRALLDSGLVKDVVRGDEKESEYTVVSLVQPDLIAFGYDQKGLREDLLAFLKRTGKSIDTLTLSSFAPEKFKSSILNGKH